MDAPEGSCECEGEIGEVIAGRLKNKQFRRGEYLKAVQRSFVLCVVWWKLEIEGRVYVKTLIGGLDTALVHLK